MPPTTAWRHKVLRSNLTEHTGHREQNAVCADSVVNVNGQRLGFSWSQHDRAERQTT